jgi:hypothetical protein
MSDPNLLGKAAWNAFRRAAGEHMPGPKVDTSWEEMCADPELQAFVEAWKSAGRAAAFVHSAAEKQKTLAAGYAGVLRDGTVVDRRIHPEAMPMQANSLLGIPEPKPVHKLP